MARYELIVEANGYTSINGLASITIADGGYGWSIGSTFSIGTGGAVGVVSTLSTPTGSSFLINIDAVGSGGDITASSITANGINYTVGEYVSLLGGTTLAIIKVLAINGSGGITSYGFMTGGSGYTLNDSAYGQPIASVTSASISLIGAGYVIGTTYTTSGVGFLLTVIGSTLNYNSSAYLDTENEVDSSVSLNYNIADISDISSKNSGYSKTITLPDTKNNREVFQYIFGINSDSTFDAGKKSRVWVVKDSVTQFEGYLQMTNIIYDRKTNKNYYEVIIYDDGNGLFVNMGEKYLSDLDLSRFDYVLNATSITQSWSKDYTNGYVYPLVDYGFPLSMTGSNLGVLNILPAIYVKPIFDQIMVEAGYSYTSQFLNGSVFKKLILPFNNKTLIPTTPIGMITDNNTLFRANPGGTVSASLGVGTSNNWSSFVCNVESYDPNGYYNTTSHYYSATTTGFAQRLRIDLDIVMSGNSIDPWDTSGSDLWIVIKRSKDPITGVDVAGWSDTPTFAQLAPAGVTAYPYITINGGAYWSMRSSAATITTLSSGVYQCVTTIYSDYLIDYPLYSGEQVRFFFVRYALGGTPRYTYINPTTVISSEINPTILVNNSNISIANLVPANVKQKDFVSSLFKMFNLYCEPDNNNPINLIIEDRDSYYNNNQVIKDWSKKLDLMMPIDSQITSNTQKKVNTFTYKADKDIYNTDYTTGTKNIYGDYKFNIDNDFISDEQKTEVIFSPTPIARLPGSQDIYLPIICNMNNGAYTHMDGMNIRILYYNKQTLNPIDIFNFAGINYPFYPYAGPFDNPLDPTLSLNFGQIYSSYDRFNETTNNLFYNYYQNQMLELSDKNSRIITAYFNLNAVDIGNFKFSDLIFCKINDTDGYYRVNKIMDYDPSINQSTKVELLKALELTIPKNIQYIQQDNVGNPIPINQAYRVGNISTSTSNILNDVNIVVAGRNNNISSGNNIVIGDNHSVLGKNNVVSGNNHTISGSNNIVNGYNNVASSNNFILGDNHNITGNNNLIIGNNISSSADNVTILGGSNMTATQSDSVYARGTNITNSITNRVLLVIEDATFNGPFTSGASSLLKANTMINIKDQVTIDWWFSGSITTLTTFTFTFLSATTGTTLTTSIPTGAVAFDINVKNEILRTTGLPTPGFHTATSRVTITKSLTVGGTTTTIFSSNMILLDFTQDLPITYTISGGSVGDTIFQRSYTQEYKGAPSN